ncbi:hypothetical protein Tco_1147148 [Tanacetum coccineum]
MADHSHNWYDETTTRERINDVLDNVDAIHESFKGEHLTKEYPLKKEDEAIKHSKYMESLDETIIKFCEDTIKKQTMDNKRMRKILENTESNIRALKTRTNNLQENAYQLTHKVLTNTGEKSQGNNDNGVMQPLTPQTVHITSLDDDYVAPTTNPMSNKQLNKFEEEFSHITEVAKKEYDNPVIKTYDSETFIRKLLHQVSQSSREMKS